MPRTYRPSPARARHSDKNAECPPLGSAEAPPVEETAVEETALAPGGTSFQEVMARSKSPPRQLRPGAMPKLLEPGGCAEAGYQGQSLRKAAPLPTPPTIPTIQALTVARACWPSRRQLAPRVPPRGCSRCSNSRESARGSPPSRASSRMRSPPFYALCRRTAQCHQRSA